MAGGGTAEIMLISHIAQRRFCVFDRTDTAKYVVEDFAWAFLENLIITAFERYIVGIGGQQDDIAVFAEIQRFNDALIERIAQPRVAQMRAAQTLQQTMFITVFDLRSAERNV